jgi:uncharacterized protein
MSPRDALFARAAACEASLHRMGRLERMSYGELQTILTGDPVEAALWVRSAAEHGMAAAQLRLGRMLLEGRGVVRDEREAYFWFKRAVGQGNAEAMNMLGRCYENGWGVEMSLQAAADSYRSSARAAYDWGEYNFGNALLDGRGVTRDQRRALYWYVCAACQGHARAMNLAARCLEEGWGCRRNPSEAAYWYQRSAESGYFRAQYNYAALLLEQGRHQSAADWFSRAAAHGDDGLRRAVVRRLAASRHPGLAAVTVRVASLLARGGQNERQLTCVDGAT